MAQVKIRLPEATKAALERSAAEAGRSLNVEVVARLEESLESHRLLLLNRYLNILKSQLDLLDRARRLSADEVPEGAVKSAFKLEPAGRALLKPSLEDEILVDVRNAVDSMIEICGDMEPKR